MHPYIYSIEGWAPVREMNLVGDPSIIIPICLRHILAKSSGTAPRLFRRSSRLPPAQYSMRRNTSCAFHRKSYSSTMFGCTSLFRIAISDTSASTLDLVSPFRSIHLAAMTSLVLYMEMYVGEGSGLLSTKSSPFLLLLALLITRYTLPKAPFPSSSLKSKSSIFFWLLSLLLFSSGNEKKETKRKLKERKTTTARQKRERKRLELIVMRPELKERKRDAYTDGRGVEKGWWWEDQK